MIGDKLIDIVGDNIVMDDEVYIGTPGLWSLITDKTPKEYDEKLTNGIKSLSTKLTSYNIVTTPAAITSELASRGNRMQFLRPI